MKIGEIVAASVIDGLVAKLQLGNPEELKIAFPVIVEGARYDFYCLVEDVLNEESDIADQLAGSTIADVIVPRPETHEGYGGPIFYSKAKLRMIQLVDRETKKLSEPQTIPPYFSSCRHATRDDVELIYEVTDTSATLGTITGVEPFHVQLDMKKLVEKPFAIFGRTGTGKSILNKLVCAGILSKDVGSVLIFDMHSEYGVFSATDKTEGLKFFFPGKVEIFSLDPKNREAKPFVLDTGMITPEDLIVALQDLTAPMVDTLYEIAKTRGGQDLISAVKEATMEMLGSERAHEMTLQGLKRRIGRLDRLPFLKPMKEGKDAFAHILAAIRAGKSVVLDFGDYGTDQMVYLFVANILSRRLFDLYTEQNEDPGDRAVRAHVQPPRPRDAEVQSHPRPHRPATVPHLRRGPEPAGEPPRDVPQRTFRRRGGPGRRPGQEDVGEHHREAPLADRRGDRRRDPHPDGDRRPQLRRPECAGAHPRRRHDR